LQASRYVPIGSNSVRMPSASQIRIGSVSPVLLIALQAAFEIYSYEINKDLTFLNREIAGRQIP